MANYFKEIAVALGVKLGEWFKIDENGFIPEFKFVFRENGLYAMEEGVEEEEYNADSWIPPLVIGQAQIIKLPWRPTAGKTCYCLTYDSSDDGWCVTAFTWDGDIADISLFAMGNCFPTEEELLAHEDEIIQRYSNAWEGIN